MSNDDRYDPSRGPRRYGPSSRGGHDHDYRHAPASGRRGNWSEVGAPGWAGEDAPTETFGMPPTPPRYGPPRHAVPPPPEPDDAPRRRGGVIAGRIISGLLSTVLVLVCGTAWALGSGGTETTSNANKSAGSVGVVTQTTDEHGNVVPVSVKGTNILIVGADSRTDANGNPLTKAEQKQVGVTLDGGGVNTDTIMILHIPDGGGKATAVSIPRDTWMGSDVVNAPGVVGPYSDGQEGPYKPNKINSFYSSAKEYETEYLVSKGVTDEAERQRESNEAGRTMLIRVLQQFTGIKIDHYAEVNLLGFYLLSQAVGGVPVCLVKAVNDRASGAHFPAGHQEVEGKSALAFVRQRHGLPRQDLDRIRRQQAFLAGAANKILSVGTLTDPGKLKKLMNAADRSLVLDNGFDLLSFAQQMVGLTSGDINFVTLPTHGAVPGVSTSALATDPDEVRAFFAGFTTDSSAASSTSASPTTSIDPSSVVVDVQNGTETSGMAASVGQVIAAAGFERGQLTDFPGTTEDNQQKTTTVRYPAGGEAAADAVLKAIGTGTTKADDAVPAGHIVIVVGTDMPRPGAPETTTSPTSTSKKSSSAALPSDAINAADPGCVN